MKPPWEWVESDIQELIANKVQESLELDYKACGALVPTDSRMKKEISKDVSSFANSAGGTIVYGVVDDKHVPTRIDVGYWPGEVGKEWLDQVVNANIHRRIDGVRIKTVHLTGSAAGKVLYVVSIPQSVRAPHMAADHRFYKRFNFESVPMEEYEVRDTGRRSEAPDLKITLRWSSIPSIPGLVELVASISNDAPEPANYAVIRLYVDARVRIIRSDLAVSGHVLKSKSNDIPVNMLTLNWSPTTKMPIWESETFLLTEQAMHFGLPPGAGEYVVAWQLTSPRMNPKQRFYTVVSDGTTLSVMEHANEGS
jgi:hypothetical protein